MKNFKILIIDCSSEKFAKLICYAKENCKYEFLFIALSKKHAALLKKGGINSSDIFCLNTDSTQKSNLKDLEYLAKSEQFEDVPTIHNMIMNDRIVNKLPYDAAIKYSLHLANEFRSLYKRNNPSVILCGHDGLHSGISLAVAKMENIPWFAWNFSTVPPGYVGLSPGIVPSEFIEMSSNSKEELEILAEKLLTDFENKNITVPRYISAHNVRAVLVKIKVHIPLLLRKMKNKLFNKSSKYTENSILYVIKQYIRKRLNMIFLPKSWFLTKPSAKPYAFLGLSMQPESTLDVFAPFYSDQFEVIDKIARSIPPTHELLVKLHISDADNYSRKQLSYLLNLPGVKLVSPTVNSRYFIEKASLIFTVAGTMAIEAGLLGKPCLMFGKMTYLKFPSVARVEDITELPKLIRAKLKEDTPSRDSILKAYIDYLKPQFKATHNDWSTNEVSIKEKEGFAKIFYALNKYINT